MPGFDLLVDFRFGGTPGETLPASLPLPEHQVSLLLASGRTLVGAEEAAAARHRHGLAHTPAQQHDGYSHVTVRV